ncbi:META domain-containing protein [Microbacterium betulae]|uniref:META domain-containing protein n=1 Tax=Microbacterium betulae TaxID=2981139 RepID=A0AA97I4A7_9MICO|nr:META domain-containing protein [Microbacterium sp. AB]WOF22411.1 META domain-containing protein [Microbacterium sp. AB]
MGLALAGCASGAGSEDDASSVVGTWQSSEANEPYLSFDDDGTFDGNDGCNGLSGQYEQDGDTVTVTFSASTLRGCEGVDTWLSELSTIEVGDASLEIYDSSGELLGSLARDD